MGFLVWKIISKEQISNLMGKLTMILNDKKENVLPNLEWSHAAASQKKLQISSRDLHHI